jgi:signal transduction histidine kinase/CheY-like chemotaxis protein/HPt (histidine-containing phosphotransfer) domain-containing protein
MVLTKQKHRLLKVQGSHQLVEKLCNNVISRYDTMRTSDTLKNNAELILKEQVKLLYANALAANYSVIAIAFICTIVLWQKIDHQPLITWFIILSLGALIRVRLAYFFKRYSYKYSTKQFANWYAIATLFVGCSWGLFSQFLLYANDPLIYSFIAILTVGVITVSVPVLAIMRLPFFAYILPPTLALIITLLIIGNQSAQLLAMCIVIYTLLIAVTGNNLHKRLLSSLKLEINNKELINHLIDEIDQKHDVQKDLVLAKEAAERMSLSKSEFLANMSHEIRTPMNAIIGLSHIALQKEPPPAIGDYLDKIHTSGQHLLDIINNILDFSKIEAGKLEIERSRFTLEEVVHKLTTITTHAIQEKGLTLNIAIDPTLNVPLKGDPLRLSQVLINLTNNAIKFTTHGSINISAKPQQKSDGQLQLYFEVQDSGIGMTTTQQEKLFKAFQQAEISTSRTHGGTGLGLVISKQLTELMGGEIGISSTPGQGSTFWFTIDIEHDNTPISNIAGNNCMVDLSGRHILIVDDNKLNQQIAQELLHEKGIITEVANDGLEAIELVSCNHFDVVLMDVQMPILDGLEATRLIRISKPSSELPIIAMTANATKRERERCLSSGMDDFIAKPIQPKKINNLLAQWLQQKTVSNHSQFNAKQVDNCPLDDTLFPNANDPNIIDIGVLNKLLKSNPAKVKKFVHLFLQLADETVTEIKTAQQRHELEKINFIGHRMKSQARTVGAHRLGDLCQELEELSEDSTPKRVDGLIKELDHLMKQIYSRLDHTSYLSS